jgi:hypothetical protein
MNTGEGRGRIDGELVSRLEGIDNAVLDIRSDLDTVARIARRYEREVIGEPRVFSVEEEGEDSD